MTLGVINLHQSKLMNWKLIKRWSCKPKIETSLNSMTNFSVSTIALFQIAYFFTIFALLLQRRHFLIALLCLEGIILTLVLLIPIILYSRNLAVPTVRIIILTLGACEASLGLRILVNISRSNGSDILKSITTNKC